MKFYKLNRASAVSLTWLVFQMTSPLQIFRFKSNSQPSSIRDRLIHRCLFLQACLIAKCLLRQGGEGYEKT